MKLTLRRAGAAVAAATAIALTSGCSYNNAQQTTLQYNPSDGVRADLGEVLVRNLLLVSEAQGQPGRFLGAAVNESNQPQTLTLTPTGAAPITVTVPGATPDGTPGEYNFQTETNKQIIPSTAQPPGANEIVKLAVGSNAQDLNVPVVDGTLEDYRPFLPSHTKPIPTKGIETASPGPSATNMGNDAAEASAQPTPAAPATPAAAPSTPVATPSAPPAPATPDPTEQAPIISGAPNPSNGVVSREGDTAPTPQPTN